MTTSDPTAVALAQAGFTGPGAAVNPPVVAGTAPDIVLDGGSEATAPAGGGGGGGGWVATV